MPKSVAAEWFLRLFTTPDRAAALAGDMSEEGRVSWFDTLGTAAALFFRNVAEGPVRLVLLILLGTFLGAACWNLASISIRLHSFQRSEYWMVSVLFFAAERLLAPALTGYVLVRFAKGRDITACLAYGIVSTVLPLYSISMHANAVWRAQVYPGWFIALGAVFQLAFPAFVLLTSGVLTRKRYLAQ